MNTNRQYPFAPGTLTESELKIWEESVNTWNKCYKESMMKYGLPWASVATAFQYFMSRKNIQVPNENVVPQRLGLLRSGLWFLGHYTFAMICLLPSCYKEFSNKLTPLKGKLLGNQGMGGIPVKSSEESFQLHDDINFQSSLDPKLDGPSSDFSHLDLDTDFSSNENLQLEDVDKQGEALKIPPTTYDDLRRRNRENYYKQLLTSSSPQRDDLQLNTASEPQEQKAKSPFPSKNTRKNKYGDDIE